MSDCGGSGCQVKSGSNAKGEPMGRSNRLEPACLACCALILSCGTGWAQSPGPQPLPMPTPIASPKDTPYPGTIRLSVDATDTERHIFNVRESIPARGGEPLVLLFPRWLPGNHSPGGRVDKLAGLKIHANDEQLGWARGPLVLFAVHLVAASGRP